MSENGLDELRRRLLERAGLSSRNREAGSQEKVQIRDLVVEKEHFKFVFLDPDLSDNDDTFLGVVYIPEDDLFLIKRTDKDVDSIHEAMIDQASRIKALEKLDIDWDITEEEGFAGYVEKNKHVGYLWFRNSLSFPRLEEDKLKILIVGLKKFDDVWD